MINQDEALAQLQLTELQLKLMSYLGFQWAQNNHLSQLKTINRKAHQKCVYDSYILGRLSLIELQKEVLIQLQQQEEWNMVHIFINDCIDNASQSSFEQVGQISEVYIRFLQTYYLMPDSEPTVPIISNNNVEVIKIYTNQIPLAFNKIQKNILSQNKKLIVLFNINVGMEQKKWRYVCDSIQEMVRNLKPTDLVGAILFERTPAVFHSLAQYEKQQFQSLSHTYTGQSISSHLWNEQMNEQLIPHFSIQRQSNLKKCCLYLCLPLLLILFLITIIYLL